VMAAAQEKERARLANDLIAEKEQEARRAAAKVSSRARSAGIRLQR
jgi:hypothetical protein